MEDVAVHPRRYTKACDACYRKKIKCNYNERICEFCRKVGQRCVFTRVERSPSKKPHRRKKYLAALEDRMETVETRLERSQETETRKDESSRPDIVERAVSEDALAIIMSRGPFTPPPVLPTRRQPFHFPILDKALRLAQGYFATSNHVLPIFNNNSFVRRLKNDYPPTKHTDLVWWASVAAVLCHAHRLRAMSTPSEADAENNEACQYLLEALEVAPKLTYGRPSMECAQLLLGLAWILRGTPMPEPARMLVAGAIHMLQDLDAHGEEAPDSPEYAMRPGRARVLWVAYTLDKDIALQSRKPPMMREQDIGRSPPIENGEDGVGLVTSLDTTMEVNLFIAGQKLAAIQGRICNWVSSASAPATVDVLESARNELNPVLLAWKTALPFGFKPKDLIGRWPKYSIVHIVVLHFRYFQTLVELNKAPPIRCNDLYPSNGSGSASRLLSVYSHSTSLVAIEAARDALDLASLTSRGNFQNFWLSLHFSISAVLTLLMNGILRPLAPEVTHDLRRVDEWLRVIGVLATTTGRPDLLEEQQFLVRMRAWTSEVLQEALFRGRSECVESQAIPGHDQGPITFDADETQAALGTDWVSGTSVQHPDVFPLDQIQWMEPNQSWGWL
ncbi:hypothetical protein LTR37_005388 [Vermiconidia calcicola]|uniref:Uncharacterized protein n=1 Tax=Vermiconidia calcicola TaxID=1690605 RepID=A0ACC3NJ79_9PEZI|nr:hypothetical protein LTR37_005388 [Vermiconidia calcicola]